MKSKILVDHDLDKNEPFIQVSLSHPDDSDLTDKILRHFISCANHTGISIVYPSQNEFNNYPQIRLTKPGFSLPDHSMEFREWLSTKEIAFSVNGSEIIIEEEVNEFNLGTQWGRFAPEPKKPKELEDYAVKQIEELRVKVKGWIGKEHEATDQIFDAMIAKVSVNLLKR